MAGDYSDSAQFLKGEDIENTPFGTKLDTEYILGMTRTEGDVKVLLEIDWVLNADEIRVLEKVA